MYVVKTIFESVPGSPHISLMRFSGSGFPADAQSAVNAVGAFWGTVDNLMTSGVTWRTDATVFDVDPATGQVTAAYSTTPQTGAGAIGGDAVPNMAQALIHWRTGVYVAGKEIRGKTYVPCLTEAANSAGGVIVSTTVSSIQAAADTLKNVTTPNPLVVWSRKNGTVQDVTTAQVNSLWATQRRRNRA